MGIKERKERERKQRVNDILEAARQLFEANGFLNTTLQDVAKEAEISVGLIYRYFESKEDIFASLALKGAIAFDKEIESVLKKALAGRKKRPAAEVLEEIAMRFFDFYERYGEYFDLLIYSFKGLKRVQIQNSTLTRLMSITLRSLDRLKEYVLASSEFGAQEEEDALGVVFLLWSILLGSHKLFDSSGRGHLFALGHEEFLRQMIRSVMSGVGSASSLALKDLHTDPHTPSPRAH